MKTIRTERTGSVQAIWLNNPPYNFLTSEMMSELRDLLHILDGDPNVRAVVVTSALEGTFVSHYDIAEILAGVQAAPVAALNGRALGGGCELSLACEIRLMADGPYEIGQPEILVGIIPGGGGTQMLTRVLGPARALELCLEGAPITPQEARDIGPVTRLVDPEELLTEAQVTAARLAHRSPTAVAAIKRAVYEGGSASLEKGLHIERSEFLAAASTPSAKRAMASYVDDIDAFRRSGKDLSEFISDKLPGWLDGSSADFTE